MYKIAVIGDRDSIYGYASVGLDCFFITEELEARHKIRELVQNNYCIIYITEELASRIEDELSKYEKEVVPAIVLIPGVYGNTGKGIMNVKKSVERAVGSDIIFNK